MHCACVCFCVVLARCYLCCFCSLFVVARLGRCVVRSVAKSTADVLPIHRRVLGSLASVYVQVDTRSIDRGGYVWEHVTSMWFLLVR